MVIHIMCGAIPTSGYGSTGPGRVFGVNPEIRGPEGSPAARRGSRPGAQWRGHRMVPLPHNIAPAPDL